MKPTRNTFYLARLPALFLFAGMLTLHAAAARQSGEQSDSSSTNEIFGVQADVRRPFRHRRNQPRRCQSCSNR